MHTVLARFNVSRKCTSNYGRKVVFDVGEENGIGLLKKVISVK
jgi:hypothetical protein